MFLFMVFGMLQMAALASLPPEVLPSVTVFEQPPGFSDRKTPEPGKLPSQQRAYEEPADFAVFKGNLSHFVWREAFLQDRSTGDLCRISDPEASGMLPGFLSSDLSRPRQKALTDQGFLPGGASHFPECGDKELNFARPRVREAVWAAGDGGGVQTAALSPLVNYGMVCVGWSGITLAGFNMSREENERWLQLSRLHNASLATVSMLLSVLGNMSLIRRMTRIHPTAGWGDLFRWVGKVAGVGLVCHYATSFGILYLSLPPDSPSEEEATGWEELNDSFK